jgi:5-methyltetrahydrofolate--homocysteine methyltransferase
MSETLIEIGTRLYAGDDEAVAQLTQNALDDGLPPKAVLQDGLIKGMERVGIDFRDGVLFMPEVLLCARAMHAGMDILKPFLSEANIPSAGKVVLGTVAGDLHDIGKNLVGMMLEGGGFEIVDLGIDVPPERFIEAIREQEPDVVGLSALLTTTMDSMQSTIAAITEAGLRDKVKIIIGGAPVTQAFADEIGADGYAPDAGMAVDLMRSLMGREGAAPVG